MGIVNKNANFHGNETDFPQIKKKFLREKKSGVKNKTGSTNFSSALNTHETYEAWSHSAIVHFSSLIVNTATAVTLMGRR